MMTPIWKIFKIDRQASDGLVVNVHYRICSSLDEQSVYIQSVMKLKKGSTFIPFEDLTEEVVISWIKSSLGDAGVLEKENHLLSMITEKEEPLIISEVPWS